MFVHLDKACSLGSTPTPPPAPGEGISQSPCSCHMADTFHDLHPPLRTSISRYLPQCPLDASCPLLDSRENRGPHRGVLFFLPLLPGKHRAGVESRQ